MKQFLFSVQFYQKMKPAVFYNTAKLEKLAVFKKRGFLSVLSVPGP